MNDEKAIRAPIKIRVFRLESNGEYMLNGATLDQYIVDSLYDGLHQHGSSQLGFREAACFSELSS